jgi:hypothetical protein
MPEEYQASSKGRAMFRILRVEIARLRADIATLKAEKAELEAENFALQRQNETLEGAAADPTPLQKHAARLVEAIERTLGTESADEPLGTYAIRRALEDVHDAMIVPKKVRAPQKRAAGSHT